MDKQKGPTGFIVVLPGEVIEIPQDSDKSWLTLFYSLPRELAEKWKPAYDLPRCPYEVLRTDKYDHIVCDDMFKLLVWDCYAWSAWQFFQVKDRKGNYRDIPGNWTQYAGYFPLWRLSYSIILYIRMKFEQNRLGFQNLYNIPQGVEVPWLTYQQFSNLIGNVTDMVIAEQNWQPMIDTIWENRTVEDYEASANVAYELTFLLAAVVCFVYVVLIKRDRLVPKMEAPKYLGAVCETAGQFAYIYAIADTEHLAMSAPIIASYCAASVLWSRIFLKEKLSWKHYAMIALIVAGIAIMGVFDL